MKFDVIPTRNFARNLKKLAKKYPSIKGDIKNLATTLSENPLQGVLITANTYKIRMAISSKGKGKSGGARIITHVYTMDEEIFCSLFMIKAIEIPFRTLK